MAVLIVISIRRGSLGRTRRGRKTGKRDVGMGMAERQTKLQRQREQRQQ